MFGMICRADDSGLGVQTWEIARHLRPDRIVIIAMDDQRGVFRPERYDSLATHVRVVPHVHGAGVALDDLAWLYDCAQVFTVESPYNEGLVDGCVSRGIRFWLYANPELFPAHHRDRATAGYLNVLAPTGWETDRLGPHKVLPMPVARDRIVHRHRSGPARLFVHVSAPAFHDRHGTDLVYAAIDVYDGPPIKVLIAGPKAPTVRYRRGPVSVVPVGHVEDYWTRYDIGDVLLLPRRYGGLSLVMQEALAAGMPVLALDREPERDWPGVTTVPVVGEESVRMKGGRVPVARCDPQTLATRMAALASNDLGDLSTQADRYAEAISWSVLLPAWRATLGV